MYTFISLGMVAKKYNKRKAFAKTKIVFMSTSNFLRKILLFISFQQFILFVKKIPRYLKEILNTINNPVISLYKHPFNNTIINENNFKNPFKFLLFIFSNNKPYGFLKVRKKGRLKRKISKKIIMLNRILD